eukprot:301795_1
MSTYHLFVVLLIAVHRTLSEINSFGFKTSIDGGTNSDILLTLYWNLDVFQCTIQPSQSSTEYLCEMNNPKNSIISCFNNQFDSLYKLHIDNINNHTNTLQIESIIVLNEFNYDYGINKFCINLNSSHLGKNLISNNCSLISDNGISYKMYQNICLNNIDCNPSVDISFNFTNYAIVTSGTMSSLLTCSPSKSPTLAPTNIATYSDDGNYIHVYVGPISWIEANEYCLNRFDTNLATIIDQFNNAEAAYLVHIESITNNLPTNSAYFGVNKLHSQNYWRFIGAYDADDFGYYNWDLNDGEPKYNCGIIGDSGQWFTTSCAVKHNISILCNAYSKITDGLTYSGTYRYNFLGPISWSQANTFCFENYGTTLATITSQQENKEIADTMINLKYSLKYIAPNICGFIGLRKMKDTANWRWMDESQLNYTSWETGQPNMVSNSCGTMCGIGRWFADYCYSDLQRFFFCNAHKINQSFFSPTNNPTSAPTVHPTQPTLSPTITTEYTSNGNYIYVYLGREIDWIQANEWCLNAFGTQLATVTSSVENLEISYMINLKVSTLISPTTCSYIGLNNLQGISDWRWVDGTQLNYTNWNQGQPNFVTGIACAEICTGKWFDVWCHNDFLIPFLCNAPNPIQTSSTPTMHPTNNPTQPTASPTNTIVYTTNGNYIYVYLGTEIDWITANEWCFNERGTSLATIDSLVQNAEISYSLNVKYSQKISPSTCGYIGLTNFHGSNEWKWIDGTESNYTNWRPNEPTITNAIDCAMMCGTGTWIDIDCHTDIRRPFVCNRYKPKTIHPTVSPTNGPTLYPTSIPTTLNPSHSLTIEPSLSSYNPYQQPTLEPTMLPSFIPSTEPTIYPTFNPTFNPTTHYPTNGTPSPTILVEYTSKGNYILVYIQDSTNWVQANEFCIDSYQTTLATITSSDQNAEITLLLNLQHLNNNIPSNCAYIGLHNLHNIDHWMWIDGNLMNYSNWRSNSPIISDTYRCSKICGNGKWENIDCSYGNLYSFICNAPNVLSMINSTKLQTMYYTTTDTTAYLSQTALQKYNSSSSSHVGNDIYIMMIIVCILLVILLIAIILIFIYWTNCRKNHIKDMKVQNEHIQLQPIIEQVSALTYAKSHIIPTSNEYEYEKEEHKTQIETETLQSEETNKM